MESYKKRKEREKKLERIFVYHDWDERSPSELHLNWEQWLRLRELRKEKEESKSKNKYNSNSSNDDNEYWKPKKNPKLDLVEKFKHHDIRLLIEAYNNRTEYKYYYWHDKSSGGCVIGNVSYNPTDIKYVIDYRTNPDMFTKLGFYKSTASVVEYSGGDRMNRKGQKCGEKKVRRSEKLQSR
ncbi:MAG: hypothetical protein M0R46_17550 [Candidatus Muirbacterium halophilum]|nr:hypothetical protein [Candidatus Muirbacterium halophilum]